MLAFLVLPGVVAYAVPALLAPSVAPTHAWRWAGLGLLGIGTLLLVWCARDFYIAGKGTLAPWTPPRQLVTVGLYRRSRNPMYVAVLTVVLGWALWYASATLLAYALFLAVAFHLRVVLFEEPRLEQAFGEEWRRYRNRVPRWFIAG